MVPTLAVRSLLGAGNDLLARSDATKAAAFLRSMGHRHAPCVDEQSGLAWEIPDRCISGVYRTGTPALVAQGMDRGAHAIGGSAGDECGETIAGSMGRRLGVVFGLGEAMPADRSGTALCPYCGDGFNECLQEQLRAARFTLRRR